MYVGLGWLGPVGEAENFERINNVSINISYSYIAGLIFYLFTSTLPYYLKKTKIKAVIKDKESIIYGRLHECRKAPFPLGSSCDTVSAQDVVNQYENTSIRAYGYFAIPVYDYLRAQRTDIKDVIRGLMVYSDYLSTDEYKIIEQINDSLFFSQINVFQYDLMDTPDQRKKLADYLNELLNISSSFQ